MTAPSNETPSTAEVAVAAGTGADRADDIPVAVPARATASDSVGATPSAASVGVVDVVGRIPDTAPLAPAFATDVSPD